MSVVIKMLTLIDLSFLLLLMLSATLEGVLSDFAYLLAFLIPFAIGFYYSKIFRREREEERGLAEPLDTYLSIDRGYARDFAPLIIPSVTVIFALALLTSLLLNSLGFTNAPVEEKGIVSMLIIHALVPAFFEEALFRYIPMKLLAPYSKRLCILFSSLYFALIHANLFQMPYAFVAGIIFMSVNLAFNSVLPSLILHLVNNTLSVVCMKYCSTEGSLIIFFVALLILSALCGIVIALRRKVYAAYIKSAFERGVGYASTNAPIALIAMSVYIAAINLLQ